MATRPIRGYLLIAAMFVFTTPAIGQESGEEPDYEAWEEDFQQCEQAADALTTAASDMLVPIAAVASLAQTVTDPTSIDLEPWEHLAPWTGSGGLTGVINGGTDVIIGLHEVSEGCDQDESQ